MRTHLTANKRIAIIGGGPVGLATARLLQLKGVNVTVYERDTGDTARISGGTLDIHKKTGQKTLAKAGLLDVFLANSRPTGQKIVDRLGNIIFDMAPDKTKPEIDRPVLRKILLDSVQPGTIVWDRHVVKVVKDETGYQLHFQNGHQAEADLVIVADGGRSKARTYVTDTLPEETGTYVIQGEIRNFKQDCPQLYRVTDGSNLAIIEDKKALFLQRRGDGSLCFYASFRKTTPWLATTQLDFTDRTSVKSFLHELFTDWSDTYNEPFDAADEYIGFPLRVFHVHELQKPHTNITLVGDAAHLMPPFGGMGVNMGLVDALTLTDNLTSDQFDTIDAAIADYERKLIDYAAPVQQGAHAADDRIHTQYSNSFSRLKKVKLMAVGKIVQFATLLLLLLVTGVFWGVWLALSQSYQLLSVDELAHVARILVANLAIPMRVISVTCVAFLVASVWLFPTKKSRTFYYLLGSVGLIVLALVITVVIEVPINNQVVTWTSATAPANWEGLRNRWQLFNSIRTGAALVSFGLFAAAILQPFAKQNR